VLILVLRERAGEGLWVGNHAVTYVRLSYAWLVGGGGLLELDVLALHGDGDRQTHTIQPDLICSFTTPTHPPPHGTLFFFPFSFHFTSHAAGYLEVLSRGYYIMYIISYSRDGNLERRNGGAAHARGG
jgi:hypothetical protein